MAHFFLRPVAAAAAAVVVDERGMVEIADEDMHDAGVEVAVDVGTEMEKIDVGIVVAVRIE